MNLIGWIHTVAAVVALVAGAAVLRMRKGTRRHRQVGWAYAAGMLTLNVTALLIYRLFGGFGPFHVAALLSLGTLVMGLLAVRRRGVDGRWVERHYYWMTYSYVGLVAAAVSEVATRMPGTRFWWMVLLASLAVFAVGARLVRRGAGAALRPFLGTR